MFDLRRFARLATAHWAENRKAYAWFLGTGVMLHFIVVLLMLNMDNGFRSFQASEQGGLYYTGLFILTPIFAGRYFQKMSNRQTALLQLMRPASLFEKWLLALIVVALLYPVAYTLAFYICDLPGLLIARGRAEAAIAAELAKRVTGDNGGTSLLGYGMDLSKYSLFFLKSPDDAWLEMLPVGLWLLTLQGFAVFGSLYFQRAPFIKTFLVAFLFMLLTILLASILDSRPDTFFGYWGRETDALYSDWQRLLYPAIWFVTPLLLWLACYFGLKEREIAA